MNTRWLMTASAGFMGLLGVAGLFLPQELLGYIGASPDPQLVVLVQAAAALYLGFAGLNWMGRGGLMGGIYGRPVTLGNFMHFSIVAVTLIKVLFAQPDPKLILVAGIYACFAAWFGYVLFTHPGSGTETK